MAKNLIIVESPAKTRTIEKYLGKDFKVMSTIGHIKDLPKKELGIEPEEKFKTTYVTIQGKEKVIKQLKDAAKDIDNIYLATDPDREGEAIAFHTAEVMKKKGKNFYRILFYELTKLKILEAIQNPLTIDVNKYNAQQARRILDRLVGYKVSPLLWRKVKGGLSAGRVQSVALRIICEREKEIEKFDPKEYWSISLLFKKNKEELIAKLTKKNDKKIEIQNEKESKAIIKELDKGTYVVDAINKKTLKRTPYPPFITSTMQQDAIREFKFTAKKTMMVAQTLYEGVKLDKQEYEGLITYMRTDSKRVSEVASEEAYNFIQDSYGKDYLPLKKRVFKSKGKIQDAHEAIRPTSVYRTPEKMKKFLTNDQFKLYSLIWSRFVASQMVDALINQNSITIKNGDYAFTLTGSNVKFDGFLKVYRSLTSNENEVMLPDFKKGEDINKEKIVPKQHFTKPPPRFSEATLVKELEENEVGRPSTYATILSTITNKEYVERIKGYFKPSELGMVVNKLLTESFDTIFNINFTAKMEDSLDKVETEGLNYVTVLEEFYKKFKGDLESAQNGMLSMKGVGLDIDLKCPKCSAPLKIKIGKNGFFIACSKYPECNYTSNYERDEKGKITLVKSDLNEKVDLLCEKCKKPMVIKHGRFGKFLACSGYPDCKNTSNIGVSADNNTKEKTNIKCPETSCKGYVVMRKSKRGRVFYGCSNYPKCKFASWDKPINEKCPDCGSKYLVEKTTKKDGTFIKCPNKECLYRK